MAILSALSARERTVNNFPVQELIKVTKIGTGREDMVDPPESEVGNMMIVQLQIG